jgi:hypothetical protein
VADKGEVFAPAKADSLERTAAGDPDDEWLLEAAELFS